MRPGRRFGMILHAKNRLRFVPQTFNGLVVQINAVHGNIGRQRFRVHRETVILRGDFHFAALQIFDRLIPPRWPNFNLKVFPPNAWPKI